MWIHRKDTYLIYQRKRPESLNGLKFFSLCGCYDSPQYWTRDGSNNTKTINNKIWKQLFSICFRVTPVKILRINQVSFFDYACFKVCSKF